MHFSLRTSFPYTQLPCVSVYRRRTKQKTNTLANQGKRFFPEVMAYKNWEYQEWNLQKMPNPVGNPTPCPQCPSLKHLQDPTWTMAESKRSCEKYRFMERMERDKRPPVVPWKRQPDSMQISTHLWQQSRIGWLKLQL